MPAPRMAGLILSKKTVCMVMPSLGSYRNSSSMPHISKKCWFEDVSGEIDFDGNSQGGFVVGLPYRNPQNSGKITLI